MKIFANKLIMAIKNSKRFMAYVVEQRESSPCCWS